MYLCFALTAAGALRLVDTVRTLVCKDPSLSGAQQGSAVEYQGTLRFLHSIRKFTVTGNLFHSRPLQVQSLVSTWFSTYSWIVSTPHSVHVYPSCTQTNPDSEFLV